MTKWIIAIVAVIMVVAVGLVAYSFLKAPEAATGPIEAIPITVEVEEAATIAPAEPVGTDTAPAEDPTMSPETHVETATPPEPTQPGEATAPPAESALASEETGGTSGVFEIVSAESEARFLAPEREIECSAPPDVAAWGQADALKQVLLILLDNAIKHGDGPITVTSEVLAGGVAVSVHDTGPGIDPDLVPHLFERFVAGSEANAGMGPGEDTGLGLAIAKALVEAQAGTIRVESQVGESTVFSVILPQAAAPRKVRPTCT